VTYRRGRLGEVGVPDLQLCHRDHQDWEDAMEGAGLYAKAGMQDAPPAFRNIALPIGFRCAVRTAKTPLPCWECHCSLTLLTFACAVAEMFSLVQDQGVPPHRNPL
jgi:hypothetical protein